MLSSLSFLLLQEDDAELAKKLAALKWHGKELEVRKLIQQFCLDLGINLYIVGREGWAVLMQWWGINNS